MLGRDRLVLCCDESRGIKTSHNPQYHFPSSKIFSALWSLSTMKFSNCLGSLLLPLTASTTLLPRQANVTIIHFGIIAIRSASPIHFASVNANGEGFWIGKDTSSFCPLANTTLCPPGTDTAFITVPGSDFLGMVRWIFTFSYS